MDLLDELNYVESVNVNDWLGIVTIELNGNFKRNYQKDMQHTEERLAFMDKYGDPLEGLDLRKSIVVWYPTYFMLVRIMFVVGSMFLWNRPLTVLAVRVMTSLFGFCAITVIRPFESVRAINLELMNEGNIIFLIDIIVFFTDLLNTGNS